MREMGWVLVSRDGSLGKSKSVMHVPKEKKKTRKKKVNAHSNLNINSAFYTLYDGSIMFTRVR